MLIYFYKSWKRIAPPLNPKTSYPNLEEMLALRKLGWSYMALADRYNVQKDVIRHLCTRFGLNGNKIVVSVFRSPDSTTRPELKTQHNEQEEPLNPGKTYAEYLQEERERKWRRLTRT